MIAKIASALQNLKEGDNRWFVTFLGIGVVATAGVIWLTNRNAPADTLISHIPASATYYFHENTAGGEYALYGVSAANCTLESKNGALKLTGPAECAKKDSAPSPSVVQALAQLRRVLPAQGFVTSTVLPTEFLHTSTLFVGAAVSNKHIFAYVSSLENIHKAGTLGIRAASGRIIVHGAPEDATFVYHGSGAALDPVPMITALMTAGKKPGPESRARDLAALSLSKLLSHDDTVAVSPMEFSLEAAGASSKEVRTTLDAYFNATFPATREVTMADGEGYTEFRAQSGTNFKALRYSRSTFTSTTAHAIVSNTARGTLITSSAGQIARASTILCQPVASNVDTLRTPPSHPQISTVEIIQNSVDNSFTVCGYLK